MKLYSSLLPSRPQTTGSHVTVLGTPGTFYTFISSQSPASFIGRKKRSGVKSFHPQRTLAIELSCKDRVKYKRSFGKGLKKIVQKCAILAKRCERLAPQLSCASSWRIETLCTMLDGELETGHLKWTLQATAGLEKNCDGIWRLLLPRPCSPSVEYTLDGGLSASYKSPRDKIPKYLCLPNVKWGCKFFCLKGGGKYAPVVVKGIQWDKPSFVWSSFGFIHCWSLIQWLTTKYSDFINVHSWNILFGAELLTIVFEKQNNSHDEPLKSKLTHHSAMMMLTTKMLIRRGGGAEG